MIVLLCKKIWYKFLVLIFRESICAVIQKGRYEGNTGENWRMDEKENQGGILETVEASKNKIWNAYSLWNWKTQSIGICEHKERAG